MEKNQELKQLETKHFENVKAWIDDFKKSEDFQNFDEEEQKDWDFAASRLFGIGGSDVAAILGLSPYKTPFELWQQKTLRAEPKDLSVQNAFTTWGHLLEDVIRGQYIKTIGKYYGEYEPSYIGACEDLPCLRVNLDGVIKKDGILIRGHEIKTAMTNAYRGDFDAEGRPILSWGEGNHYVVEGDVLTCIKEDNQIPPTYYIQVQTYMLALGLEVFDVSVLIGHHDMRTFTVHANAKMQELIKEKVGAFWYENVLKDNPPELIAADYETHKNTENLKTITPEIEDKFKELLEVRLKYNQVSAQKKDLENVIKTYIGDDLGLADPKGKVLATWKTSAAKEKFNEEKFEQENPDLYKEYLEQSAPRRTFLVKVK